MIHTVYGVRVSEREFALAKAYLDRHTMVPQLQAKAEWLVNFCRDFGRQARP